MVDSIAAGDIDLAAADLRAFAHCSDRISIKVTDIDCSAHRAVTARIIENRRSYTSQADIFHHIFSPDLYRALGIDLYIITQQNLTVIFDVRYHHSTRDSCLRACALAGTIIALGIGDRPEIGIIIRIGKGHSIHHYIAQP